MYTGEKKIKTIKNRYKAIKLKVNKLFDFDTTQIEA